MFKTPKQNLSSEDKLCYVFQLSFRYQNICFAAPSLKQSVARGFGKWEEAIRKASLVCLAAIQEAFTHKSKVLSKKKPLGVSYSETDQNKEKIIPL